MKKFNLVLFVFILCLISSAYTISGGISYTVETARQISFENIPLKISMEEYKIHFQDKNLSQNMKAKLTHKNKLKDRYLTFFSDNKYGVIYKKDTNKGYYYNSFGKLEYIELTYSNSFPKKSVRYDLNGNIDSCSLWVSSTEQFIFDTNKKLIAHWKNKNKYNEQGELIDTRE